MHHHSLNLRTPATGIAEQAEEVSGQAGMNELIFPEELLGASAVVLELGTYSTPSYLSGCKS